MIIPSRIDPIKFKKPFDLIVIGGGINGAGIARDAAQRGLSVLLLEKNDFAFGCTSHSTRLIHGGLRYLEHGEFSLVHESLQEREILLKSYPNLVHPMGLFIPSYKGNKHSLFKLNLGMLAYDLLSYKKALKPYKRIDKDKLQEMATGLNEEDLEGGVFYHDAQVPFVERLCLENILTAQEHGAICLNHCEVTEIKCDLDDGKFIAKGVKFRDALDKDTPYEAKGRHIINVSGPWVDELNSRLRQPNNMPTYEIPQEIGGTKGSHIMVKDFPGAPKNHGIYSEAKADGRPFFTLPFKLGMNEDVYLIGTTDIFLGDKDDLDNLKITREEIQYLLKEVNELFPDAELTQSDIIKTFCGVRPLPYIDPKRSKEGAVTRKHFIHKHTEQDILNYYSIVGGKITTFRNLAKEVVDMFSFDDSETESKPTIGSEAFWTQDFTSYAREFIDTNSYEYGLDEDTVLHLLILYGSKAKKILDLCSEDPNLKNKIHEDFADIEAQILYAIRYENAYTIDDILNRRLSIGLLRDKKNLSKLVYRSIINHLANEFEYTRVERQDMLDEYCPALF